MSLEHFISVKLAKLTTTLALYKHQGYLPPLLLLLDHNGYFIVWYDWNIKVKVFLEIKYINIHKTPRVWIHTKREIMANIDIRGRSQIIHHQCSEDQHLFVCEYVQVATLHHTDSNYKEHSRIEHIHREVLRTSTGSTLRTSFVISFAWIRNVHHHLLHRRRHHRPWRASLSALCSNSGRHQYW